MPRRIGAVRALKKHERAYERSVTRLYLKPLFQSLRAGLATASAADQTYGLLEDRVRAFTDRAYAGVPADEVQKQLGRMERYNRERTIATFRSALGVDVGTLLARPEVRIFMTERIMENVDLIKTIPERALAGLARDIERVFQKQPFDQRTLMQLVRNEYKSSGYNLRRITRDQNSKLTGQLNKMRQEHLGIAAFQWQTVGDERVRPSHREQNGKVFAWSEGSPIGFPGTSGIQCFPGSVRIDPAGLKAAVCYRYIGQLIKIFLTEGVNITCTPNHPILTQAGWRRAADIKEGDQLLKHCRGRNFSPCAIDPQLADRDTLAENLHIFLGNTALRNRTTPRCLDLHGAPASGDEKINIVKPNSVLREKFYIRGREIFGDIGFKNSDVMFSAGLSTSGSVGSSGVSTGNIGLFREALALIFRHFKKTEIIGLAAISNWKVQIIKAILNSPAFNFHLFRHMQYGFSGMPPGFDFGMMLRSGAGIEFCRGRFQSEVTNARSGESPTFTNPSSDFGHGVSIFQQLSDLRVKGLSTFRPVNVLSREVIGHDGPIYNFETDNNILISNDIVNHNCRCVAIARITNADRNRLAE